MQSKTSSCERTFCRKLLARFWPVWALYGVIWFFAMPVQSLLAGAMDFSGEGAWRFANRAVADLSVNMGLFMALFFGLFAAMAVWSYLYNARAAGFLHAMPVRREGLFCSGWCAGLLFFALPNVAIFLLTLAAEALRGSVNTGLLLAWLAAQTLLTLFFFSLGTLCAFLTGHLVMLPLFYALANGIVSAVVGIVETVCCWFVYGWSGIPDSWETFARWCTPVWNLYETFSCDYRWADSAALPARISGWGCPVVYAVVGLVLAALALALYRRRPLELAGEVVAARWLRPLFRYGAAIVGGMALGCLLYAVFEQTVDTLGAAAMLIFMLLAGAACWLAAGMLLKKSFHVFRSGWGGCAICLAVLAAFMAAVELDLAGYETRLPDAAQISSVTLSNPGSAPYDSGSADVIADEPAELESLLALHAAMIQNKDAIEAEVNDAYARHGSSWEDSTVEGGFERWSRKSFRLTYALRDGRELTRRYSLLVAQETLDTPGTPAQLLAAAVNAGWDRERDYFEAWMTAGCLLRAEYEGRGSDSGDWVRATLPAQDAAVVYAAALEDLRAGRLGTRYLLENRDYRANTFSDRVTLVFRLTYTAEDKVHNDEISVELAPQVNSSSLIRALTQTGAISGGADLTTYAALDAAEEKFRQ